MTYAQNDIIQAADLVALVGPNPSSAPTSINTTWGIGGGSAGYGQPALSVVSVGDTITASGQWTPVVNTLSTIATHQGTSLTSIPTPASGNIVAFNNALVNNIQTVFVNRLNAATQGATLSNVVTYGSTWSNSLTFSHTVTFSSGDSARYFFTNGGQIKMTVAHPSGTGIDLLYNNLAANVGTVVLSMPTTITAVIAGGSYRGITKVGGGGNAPTLDPTRGYNGLTTANATVFTQTASTGPSSYLGSNISFVMKTNGTQGANGDAGSVITIYTIWDTVPDGLTASINSSTTMSVVLPETTNMANTWGAISLSGTVVGS